jgi:acetylglutamate kinase
VEGIHLLKQALPYIKQFRDKVFVIKFGGEVISDPERLDQLAGDLSLLHELNIRLVIIHGGGPQLSDTAKRLGIESVKIEGRRVTNDDMLEVAKMVFAGSISTNILSALRRHGTRAVGLSGVDGGLVHAVRRPPRTVVDPDSGESQEVDYQNVGDIRAVDPHVLRVLLDNRFVPVVSSLGAEDSGKVLNINADTIAAELAAALPAEKLFLLSNVNGILRDVADPSSRYSYLTLDTAEEMVASSRVRGGMMPKLAAAASAVRKGVRRAHFINGLEPSSLLYEVFTVKGFGTMLIDNDDEAAYLNQG